MVLGVRVKLINTIAVILSLFSTFTTRTFAEGFTFGTSIFYSQEKDDNKDSPPATEVKLTIYDLKLGYVMSSNIYLGAIYANENKDVVTSEEDIKATGVSLGYYHVGWFALGHYFLQTEKTFSSSDTKLSGKSGHQIDLGYLYGMSSSFVIGPQITYKNYEFSKQDPGGTDVKITKTRLLPMIHLAIIF